MRDPIQAKSGDLRGSSEGSQVGETAQEPRGRQEAEGRGPGQGQGKGQGHSPVSVSIDRRVSVASSAGQSPRHGLPDDVWGAEEGSSYRGKTPMPSDLESDFPEPEEPRHVRIVGDADFCRDRTVVVLQEPEAPAVGAGVDVLTFAVNTSLQIGEERVITYMEDEVPVVAQVEKASGWESDADVDAELDGAARGLSSPALTPEEEQQIEQYLRVATTDIKAMFRRPVLDMTGMECVSATEVQRYLNEYGARCQEAEQAEQVYRANREQAKVWQRAR